MYYICESQLPYLVMKAALKNSDSGKKNCYLAIVYIMYIYMYIYIYIYNIYIYIYYVYIYIYIFIWYIDRDTLIKR